MVRVGLAGLVLIGSLGCAAEETGQDGGPIPGDDGGISGPLEIISFTASQTDVGPNTSVELAWETRGARVIEIGTDITTLVSTFGAGGAVRTSPIHRTTTYVLTARRDGQAVNASVTVNVDWPEPRIFDFQVNPNPTQLNSFVTLQWAAADAEYISIRKNGAETVRITAMPENGLISAFVDEIETTFTLEAINPEHTTSRSVELHAEAPPEIRHFAVRPRTLLNGAATGTITWSTNGAVRTELYTLFGSGVPGFPGTASGTISVALRGDTEEFRLVAYGNSTIVESYRRVGPPVDESEPNEDTRFANSLWDTGGVRAEISTPSDVDVYTVFPQIGSSLKISVVGQNGQGCDVDTIVELSSFNRVLASDFDDGEPTGRGGSCPEIDPERDMGANELFDGQYFITVRGQRNESGRYVLLTEEF